MNLIFSYGADDDYKFFDQGHLFLGAAQDNNGSEVHVFLHKGKNLANNSKQIKFVEADV